MQQQVFFFLFFFGLFFFFFFDSIVFGGAKLDCLIGIGITPREYPHESYPGWHQGSIAWHLDDGKVFCGEGFSTKKLGAGKQGQVIEVGIEYGEDEDDMDRVYFKRNSKVLYMSDLPSDNPSNEFFPMIALGHGDRAFEGLYQYEPKVQIAYGTFEHKHLFTNASNENQLADVKSHGNNSSNSHMSMGNNSASSNSSRSSSNNNNNNNNNNNTNNNNNNNNSNNNNNENGDFPFPVPRISNSDEDPDVFDMLPIAIPPVVPIQTRAVPRHDGKNAQASAPTDAQSDLSDAQLLAYERAVEGVMSTHASASEKLSLISKLQASFGVNEMQHQMIMASVIEPAPPTNSQTADEGLCCVCIDKRADHIILSCMREFFFLFICLF